MSCMVEGTDWIDKLTRLQEVNQTCHTTSHHRKLLHNDIHFGLLSTLFCKYKLLKWPMRYKEKIFYITLKSSNCWFTNSNVFHAPFLTLNVRLYQVHLYQAVHRLVWCSLESAWPTVSQHLTTGNSCTKAKALGEAASACNLHRGMEAVFTPNSASAKRGQTATLAPANLLCLMTSHY